jgi:hypothetical protein
MHPCAVHLDRLRVEIDDEIAGLNDRVCVSLGSSHDGVPKPTRGRRRLGGLAALSYGVEESMAAGCCAQRYWMQQTDGRSGSTRKIVCDVSFVNSGKSRRSLAIVAAAMPGALM